MEYSSAYVPVEVGAIPRAAEQGLKYRARLYVARPEEYTLETYEHIGVVQSAGLTTFVGHIDKSFVDGTSERTIQLIDLSSDNRLVGAGEVRYLADSSLKEYKNKPFVGWTSTNVSRRGEGLGRRRLMIMAMSAEVCFGFKLHSDLTIASPHVHTMWRRLVQEGRAQAYLEDDVEHQHTIQRYQFIE